MPRRQQLVTGLQVAFVVVVVALLVNFLAAWLAGLTRAAVMRDTKELSARYDRIHVIRTSTPTDWATHLSEQELRSLEVRIIVGAQDLRVEYALLTVRQHSIVHAVQLGNAREDPAGFAAAVLGEVEVNGRSITYQPPTVQIEENREQAAVSLSGAAAPLEGAHQFVEVEAPALPGACCAQPRRVVVETSNVLVNITSDQTRQLVIAQSPDEVVFEGPVAERVAFDLEGIKPAGKGPDRLDAVLARISDFRIPVLGIALYWLALSLPLILFWRWHRDRRLGETRVVQRFRQIMPLLFGLYVGLLALDVLFWISSFWEPSRLMSVLPRWLDLGWTEWLGHSGLVVVAAVVVWPAVARHESTQHGWYEALPGHRGWRRLLLLVVAVPICLVMVGSITLVFDRRVHFGVVLIIIAGGLVCAAVVAALMAWMVGNVGMTSDPWRVRLATLLLIDLALLNDLRFDSALRSAVSYAIVIGAGALALAALADLLCRALYAKPLRALSRSQGWSDGWWLWGSVVLLLLAVTPFPRWSGATDLRMDPGHVRALAIWFDDIIYVSLALVLVYSLRQVGQQDVLRAGARTDCRHLGILLALAILFDPHFRFLYVPIPFVIGYLLLTKLVFPKGQRDLIQMSQELGWSRNWLVQTALDTSRTKREGKRQLAKTIDDYAAHERRNKDAKMFAKRAADNTVSRAVGWPAERVALLMGPEGKAWDNGVRAARISVAVSLPWMAFDLRGLFTQALENDEYLLLSLATTIFWTAANWAVLGFFLGYFFPYIRGHNGLWKGFYLWLAVIIPYAILTVFFVTVRLDSWGEFGFWSLQLFTTSVLVGFIAGDIQTLRNAGYGFAEAIELQNLSVLTAWGSSLVAASAGAVISFLTSDVGGFLLDRATKAPGSSGGP